MKNYVELIKNGELVAVPTETVYGLAANGLDSVAVKKIYEMKGRPEIKPLSLMVHDSTWIDRFCVNVPEQAYFLAQKYWPGPLSIVLNSKDCVPDIVRAGGKTVSLRCPDSPLTLELLKEADVPLAAPSANPSGLPSPKTAEDVLKYFGDALSVIDGGPCKLGVESTIIDLTSFPFRILREGALPAEELTESLLDNLYVVGLTGQSGSGKSLALEVLEENGYLTVDCDAVYHSLLAQSTGMLEDIRYMFPEAFSNGTLNRQLLASIVFSNEDDLDCLNSLTHPYVVSEVKRLLTEYAYTGGCKAVIEAVELFSSGLSDLCDKTIAVVADKTIRIERIMNRDNLTFESASNRVESQKSEDYYRKHCDAVIDNSSTKAFFIDNILFEVK